MARRPIKDPSPAAEALRKQRRKKAAPPEEPGVNPFAPQPYAEPEVLSPEEQEQVVLAEVLDGSSPAEAGRCAGLSRQGAGAEVMGRPHVRDALLAALEARGVGTGKLAEVLAAGLDACQSASFQGAVYGSTVPDLGMRLRYADRLLELHGIKAAAGDEGGDTWEAMIFAVRAKRAARGGE